MKKQVTIELLKLFIVAVFVTSCTQNNGKKINKRITIWRNDKIPYGAYYAYQQLPYLFPRAEIVIDRESPANKGFFQKKNNEVFLKMAAHKGRTVQFIFAPRMIPGSNELKALMDFVYEGNQVFISSFTIGSELLDSLKLDIDYYYADDNGGDSPQVSITNPRSKNEEFYGYPGITYQSFFSTMDSGYTTVLGWNKDRKPNFIKIGYESGGAIYLQLEPLAFSNFFLLHKDNKRYYDCALSNIPEGIELVVWGEYFRNHTNGDNGGNGSSMSRAFSWLLKQPPLAWALWLLVALFLLIYLFESKRRQKIIPIKKPVNNSSLDFVKTIGRLYFQRKDNKNLADKMTAHFLDHVRSRFNIATSRMDEEFEKRLAYKTGIAHSVIHTIVYQAKYLADQPSITDGELMQFNHQLQHFYKQV